MKLVLVLAALTAVATASYSCPSDRPVLLCNCRLTTSTAALETGDMSLCDYEFGQTECASHQTKNYCCEEIYESGFPGRVNGIDCTGAKNTNDVYDLRPDTSPVDTDTGTSYEEADDEAQVKADAERIVKQMILRDSRPGHEIVAWEFVN